MHVPITNQDWTTNIYYLRRIIPLLYELHDDEFHLCQYALHACMSTILKIYIIVTKTQNKHFYTLHSLVGTSLLHSTQQHLNSILMCWEAQVLMIICGVFYHILVQWSVF